MVYERIIDEIIEKLIKNLPETKSYQEMSIPVSPSDLFDEFELNIIKMGLELLQDQ